MSEVRTELDGSGVISLGPSSVTLGVPATPNSMSELYGLSSNSISLSTNLINFPSNNYQAYVPITVTSSGNWSAEKIPVDSTTDWLTISSYAGTSGSSSTVSPATSNTGAPRIAIVRYTVDGTSTYDEVSVNQAALTGIQITGLSSYPNTSGPALIYVTSSEPWTAIAQSTPDDFISNLYPTSGLAGSNIAVSVAYNSNVGTSRSEQIYVVKTNSGTPNATFTLNQNGGYIAPPVTDDPTKVYPRLFLYMEHTPSTDNSTGFTISGTVELIDKATETVINSVIYVNEPITYNTSRDDPDSLIVEFGPYSENLTKEVYWKFSNNSLAPIVYFSGGGQPYAIDHWVWLVGTAPISPYTVDNSSRDTSFFVAGEMQDSVSLSITYP